MRVRSIVIVRQNLREFAHLSCQLARGASDVARRKVALSLRGKAAEEHKTLESTDAIEARATFGSPVAERQGYFPEAAHGLLVFSCAMTSPA